jgi:hypothetical protein
MKSIEEEDDWRTPQIDIEIEGCLINKVHVDSGTGLKVITEQTTKELGYTMFEPTPKILQMANQRR